MAKKKVPIDVEEEVLVSEVESVGSDIVIPVDIDGEEIPIAPIVIKELTYSKSVIVRYYSRYRDYLTVVLDDQKLYTLTEVENILKEVK